MQQVKCHSNDRHTTELTEGNKTHQDYLKIIYNGKAKNVLAGKKTIKQLVQESEAQQLKKEQVKTSQMKHEMVAFAIQQQTKDKESSKLMLDQNLTGSKLFAKGIRQIYFQKEQSPQSFIKYDLLLDDWINQGKILSKEKAKVTQKNNKPIKLRLILQGIQARECVPITIETSQKFIDLKNKAKQAFQIPQAQHIFLQYGFQMSNLDDNQLISDFGIQDNQQIFVFVTKYNGCFPGQSRIKALAKDQNNQDSIIQIMLSQIKVGDSIISYNQQGFFEKDKVTFVQKVSSKILMQIKTKDGKSVKSTTGDAFLTKQGWKKHSIIGNAQQNNNIQKIKLTQRDLLIFCDQGQSVRKSEVTTKAIQSIEVVQLIQPVVLYHLCIQKNHTYIVEGVVVHNMQIQVSDPNYNKIYQIDAAPCDLIKTIIQKVAMKANLTPDRFSLLFFHKELEKQKSLTDYNIGKGDKLLINMLNVAPKKSVLVNEKNEKWLVIKDNEKTIRLRYQSNKSKPVWKLIQQIRSNPPRYYSLLHGNMFLKPIDKINRVQKNEIFQNTNQIHCMLVESCEQKLFYQLILRNGYKEVIQKYKDVSRLEQLISKFRSPDFNHKINTQIFKFDPTDERSTNQQNMEQLRQIILGFMGAQKYVNENNLYKVLSQNETQIDVWFLEFNLYKRQRFNRFSKRYKEGQSLYFKQFVQAKCSNYKQIIGQKYPEETIFFLRGFSARKLGKITQDAQQQEVVFLPFTYFTIDSIIVDDVQNATTEYIFLTQMQTLSNYTNPFLLWVDDQPNNISNKRIQEQLKENNPQLYIIKFISTGQAEEWMKQFAWLANWQEVRFKIISDMTRYQIRSENQVRSLRHIKGDEYFKIEERASAAIDLIQKCCDYLGFTTLIIIFCFKKENAVKRLDQRRLIRGQNYHEIITDDLSLKKNIDQFLNENKLFGLKKTLLQSKLH